MHRYVIGGFVIAALSVVIIAVAGAAVQSSPPTFGGLPMDYATGKNTSTATLPDYIMFGNTTQFMRRSDFLRQGGPNALSSWPVFDRELHQVGTYYPGRGYAPNGTSPDQLPQQEYQSGGRRQQRSVDWH